MNTLARQPNSKTFLKACIATILLVTCLTTQATDTEFKNLVSDLGHEAISTIKEELKQEQYLEASYKDMQTALVKSKKFLFNTEKDNLLASNNTSNNNSVITSSIFPSIASLGGIEQETTDAVKRQATMIALEFAIQTLENSSSNISVKKRLAL